MSISHHYLSRQIQ